MRTVKLGRTDVEITPTGFGSWAIVGGRRPDQADGIIGAAEFRLGDEEVERIEDFMRENP